MDQISGHARCMTSEFAKSSDKSFSNDELLGLPVSMSADRVEIYEDINMSET
jgi:hypothetical protein